VAFNDDIADAVIERALEVERAAAGQRAEVLKLLEQLEGDLAAELARIDPSDSARESVRARRLDSLLTRTREAIRTAYAEANSAHLGFLTDLAQLELDFAAAAINGAVGFDLAGGGLDRATLRALAKDTLIEGAPSAEWWARQAGDTAERFTDAMRQGMARGENLGQLVRRVRGSRAAGYGDGVMATSRRNAESLVRTSAQAVAHEAREESYKANDDLIKAVQWRSTLDSRVSTICAALDGLQWSLEGKPLGHDRARPGPPAHWRCRSTVVPVLRSWSELAGPNALPITSRKRGSVQEVLEQKLREKGWSEEKIAKARAHTRASMDGQVSKTASFDTWLRGRPPEVQKRILGAQRAALFQQGKLSARDLIDQSGRPLTLAELRRGAE
jgi:SPP1 gp7 family putative phage head morphogenesis protein